MKKRLVVLAVCCMLALSAALVGCGGGGGDAGKNFVGDWKLTGMTEGGEETSSDDIAALEALGMTISLQLTEDGKATLDFMGETMEGTWKAKDASTATVTLDGSDAEAKFADGKITLSQGSDTLVFSKA